ncbi:hypothetical protein CCHR01_05273 [Colletotrichum chrysophilum]|uniref:Uncharacterized protein n=1 Tax=Colletotrichum chrysophilum TaxID=1836956 RepID=A0AAD9EPN2_9PEZI|nr:hypothetical protein CCHR01_05273 [Colletotrichum chrysophilum]
MYKAPFENAQSRDFIDRQPTRCKSICIGGLCTTWTSGMFRAIASVGQLNIRSNSRHWSRGFRKTVRSRDVGQRCRCVIGIKCVGRKSTLTASHRDPTLAQVSTAWTSTNREGRDTHSHRCLVSPNLVPPSTKIDCACATSIPGCGSGYGTASSRTRAETPCDHPWTNTPG